MAAFHQHKGHIVLFSSAMMKSTPSAPLATENRSIVLLAAISSVVLDNIGINTKWIWQTHYCPFLLMRYGVRTTVRVSDEWLSVCAICLHMGLNPKGPGLHTLCQICSLLMITKNRGYKVEDPQRSGRNVPCVSCPHRLLLWCQTSEAPPCRFAFVSIINASGLVNGYKAILLSTSANILTMSVYF